MSEMSTSAPALSAEALTTVRASRIVNQGVFVKYSATYTSIAPLPVGTVTAVFTQW